jgi:hypothetical protein
MWVWWGKDAPPEYIGRGHRRPLIWLRPASFPSLMHADVLDWSMLPFCGIVEPAPKCSLVHRLYKVRKAAWSSLVCMQQPVGGHAGTKASAPTDPCRCLRRQVLQYSRSAYSVCVYQLQRRWELIYASRLDEEEASHIVSSRLTKRRSKYEKCNVWRDVTANQRCRGCAVCTEEDSVKSTGSSYNAHIMTNSLPHCVS